MLLLMFVTARGQDPQSPLTPPALNSGSRAAAGTLRVGDKAPEFSLPNGDGKLVSLSEFTSKSPVVVIFYRGFW